MNHPSNQRWVRRPIRTRTKMVSFRVSMDELRELEVEAARRQTSVSDLVRQALARLLNTSSSG